MYNNNTNNSQLFYKLSFEKDFNKLTFEGDSLRLNDLKQLLIEKLLNRKNNTSFIKRIDFDLEITNTDTDQVYSNPFSLIQKNARLSIKRIVNLDENQSSPISKTKCQIEGIKDEESMLLNSILNDSMTNMIICKLCKKPGHLNRNCPKAGTVFKPPAGIPKSQWCIIGQEKKIVTQVELNATKATNKELFLKEEEKENKTIQNKILNFPIEFKCPFGDHIIKDAVILPCCGKFVCCDSCILNKISSNEPIECLNMECNQEMGSYQFITSCIPLRQSINTYLNSLIPTPKKEPKFFSNNICYNNTSKIEPITANFKRNFNNNTNQFSIDQLFGIKKRKSDPFNSNQIKRTKI